VLLHSLMSRTAPRVLRAAGNPAQAIAWSPDGSELAEKNATGLSVRNVADGSQIAQIAVHSSCSGSTLRFSVEGDYLLTWDRTGLCAWEIGTGVLARQIAGDFSSVAMSAGQLLTAEFAEPPVVKRWALAGTDSSPVRLELPAGTILSGSNDQGVAISPRADTLAANTQGLDEKGNLVASTSSLWSASGAFRATYTNRDYATNIIYSENGAFVSIGDQLVEVASGKPRYALPRGVSGSTIDASGTHLASVEQMGPSDFAAQVFDLSGVNGARSFGALPESATITDLSISPDGTRLATTGQYTGILWRLAPDLGASEALRSIFFDLLLDANFTPNGQQVFFSGDGVLALSSKDGMVLADPGFDLPAPPPGVGVGTGCVHTSARVSPRGSWLALGEYGPGVALIGQHACPGSVQQAARPELVTARCNARSAFNADESLVATSGPELYRTSDWSRAWPATITTEQRSDFMSALFDDVQFAPDGQTLLVSQCPPSSSIEGNACSHTLRSLTDGAIVRSLPELRAARAAFSPEGHWIIAGGTALHLPSGQSLTFALDAQLSTFAPNGDIIAVLKGNSIARFCRTP
jgi:WD40 repeat protein